MSIYKLFWPALALMLGSGPALATLYFEDFEDEFPAWESRWLGTYSNVQNYYGVGAGRGNNPDGLWIDDGDGVLSGDVVEILFDPVFGASLSSFAIDVATHIEGLSIQVYDMTGASLLDSTIASTSGATIDPGDYVNISVSSVNGVAGFSLFNALGNRIEGNTGIDNVAVQSGAAVGIPAPSILALLGIGLAGFGATRRI